MHSEWYNRVRFACRKEETIPQAKVGAVIRTLREQRGLNQTELARLAGVYPSRLSRIENLNRDRVDADVLARIAKALGVTVDEIYIQAGISRVPDAEASLRLKRLERTFLKLSPTRQEELLALATTLGSLPDPTVRPSDVLQGDQPENDHSPTDE